MPGGNGTGPMGMGPMTGRGMGYCAGYNRPGYMNPVGGRGRGCGMGFGRGRGWRNMYYASGQPGWARGIGLVPQAPAGPRPEDELAALQAQAEDMQAYLKNIQARIDELKNKG